MKGGLNPMKKFITSQLNINEEDIESLDVESKKEETIFKIVLKSKIEECPYCFGRLISNGFSRIKKINLATLKRRKSTIHWKPRRFRCIDCNKTIMDTNPFTFSRFRQSFNVMNQVMLDLGNLNKTYKDIAEAHDISITQVLRYLDSFVTVPRLTLPESIGIDEISSDMAKYHSKYLCVMVDNQSRDAFEILPSRSKHHLKRYFEKIPENERLKVKYVTMDMWLPYKDITKQYLKNAIIAVDPFHVVKNLMECFANIRLNILRQVEYGSDAYHLLKKWKDLLEKDCNLDNEPRYNSRFRQKLNKRQLLEMTLAISENLAQGYELKEMYRNFNQNATSENCEEWFDALLIAFKDSTISEYEPFITLLTNWRIEILNSFKRPYDDRKLSNALSENTNGKIKIYIAISRGISNFERFRKRILFALNKKIYYSITDKVNLQSK